MNKKCITIAILIIILVSINWFRTVYASDLTNLTEEQKQELLNKYQNSQSQKKSDYYQSADFYKSNDPLTNKSFDPTNISEQQKTALNAHQMKQNKEHAKPNANQQTKFEQLKPFGMELFAHIDEQTDQPTDISSSTDYILGPGDNIIIYLWGRVEKEYNLTIDREGKVFIPQVGNIVVWGLSLEKFIHKAEKNFSKVYSDFQLTASLGKIRSIRIFVAGEVRRPGAYTVSSLTSLLNALYLSGGPSERGSMRSIKLKRQGKTVAKVDLYKLLLEGDNSTDIHLESGDVVFVPVVGPQVAIRGEIRREAVYELKGNETASDLLKLAGNPTPQAHLERVMLERISKNSEWNVIDLNLKGSNKQNEQTVLIGGDRITIYSIFEAKQNIVAIFGKVKHSGFFERKETTHISDLVNQAKLQPYDVYFERADLFRKYPDGKVEIIPVNLQNIINGDKTADILLQDKDSLQIYSIDEVERNKYVFIEGEIKNPGRYPLYENMTVNDLIFLAGSYTRSAQRHRAEVARIDENANVSLMYVSINNNEADMFKLTENDHLYIRQIPKWEQNRSISIEGAVKYPGEYTLANQTETLYELLLRSGGFTENAFPKGIIFERASINDNLNRLRVSDVINRSNPIKYDSLGQLVTESKVDYDSKSMNRIIIDMEKIIASQGQEGNIILEGNDKIYIPTIPSGISVIGAVGSNGTLKYTKGLTVKDYIKRAGNFTKQADKKQTRLIRATGEVISGGGITNKHVDVGDVIIIPTKIDKERSLMKSFSSALSAATGVLTSVYIISKL